MLKSVLIYVPPLVVFLLVCWLYYAFTIHFCFNLLEDLVKQIIYIIIYHILLLMFIWSFCQSMCKNHSPIPAEYHLNDEEHTRLLSYDETKMEEILTKIINLRNLEIYTSAPNGKIRYCKTCMVIKPDRCHHCSTCSKCVLKMDHHCPWIVNCVGFDNYKEFLLMLLYGTLACGFYVAAVSEYFFILWKDFQNNISKLLIGIGFIIALFVGILISVLVFYHMSLLSKNETTIEALYDVTFKDTNLTFDLGKWRNFTEVFGDNICCWLLPIKTCKGNGHEFQVNKLSS